MKRLVVLALLVAGCDTGFERPSLVLDLRVLGMRTDPAEVIVREDLIITPIRINTLIVDSIGPRPIQYTLTACPEEFRRRCDPELYSVKFAEGVTTTDEGPTAVLQADETLLRAALENDDFLGLGGVPVMIVLTLLPVGSPVEETLYAGKVVFYSPPFPEGRVANTNPRIEGLIVDGAPLVDGHVVAPDTVLTIEPVEPAGVRERYVVPTLDGDTRAFTENMRYSWFTDAGRVGDQQTGGAIDDFGNVPLLRTRWRSPPTPGPVRLWVVQRDERGGTYWTHLTLEVK